MFGLLKRFASYHRLWRKCRTGTGQARVTGFGSALWRRHRYGLASRVLHWGMPYLLIWQFGRIKHG